MKVRNGFVSNSSSSSFVFAYKDIDKTEAIKEFAKLTKMEEILKNSNSTIDNLISTFNECTKLKIDSNKDIEEIEQAEFYDLLNEKTSLDGTPTPEFYNWYGYYMQKTGSSLELLRLNSYIQLFKELRELFKYFPQQTVDFSKYIGLYESEIYISDEVKDYISTDYKTLILNFADGGEDFNSNYHNLERKLRYNLKEITYCSDNIKFTGRCVD